MLNDTHKLESTTSFNDFVKAFSQFGSNMVEFAHVSGDRQNVSVVCCCTLSEKALMLKCILAIAFAVVHT